MDNIKKIAPWAWTILIHIVLCLPGSTLPPTPFLHIPHFDKVVHFIIYFTWVFLWCYSFASTSVSHDRQRTTFLLILLAAIVHGTLIEFVQRYLIPNRSFDIGDIIADAAGSFSAYIAVMLKWGIKKPLWKQGP